MAANARHSSETNEHMTPAWLIEMSRYVLGKIELDPASTEYANQTVQAERIFTKRENGLLQEWRGWVFLNCPGGLVDETGKEVIRARTKKGVRYPGCTETGACGLPPGHSHKGVESSACFWWHKLMHEFEGGRCPGGVFLAFSLELLQSAQSFAGRQPLTFPNCVPKQRIRFELEVGGRRVVGRDPTHANLVVLVCNNHRYTNTIEMIERFEETFKQIGSVHVPRGW